MDTKEYVEFLCLSCGLQGSRANDDPAASIDAGGCCPKCGEKLLTISRPQPEGIPLTI